MIYLLETGYFKNEIIQDKGFQERSQVLGK